MQSLAYFFFLILTVATTAAKAEIRDEYELIKLHQEIDLRHHYTEIVTRVELKALKESTVAFVCGQASIWENAAYFVVTTGEAPNVETLTTEVKEIEGAPEDVTCMAVKLKKVVKKDSKLALEISGVFTKLLMALPKELKQAEKQKVMFESNLLMPMPYKSLEQKTTVIMPGGSSMISKTDTKVEKKGDKLVYGPFSSLPPFSAKPLRLHYVDNRPYIHATKVVKEIQLSLWGNVYIEEKYELMNDGATSVGSWSRYEYDKNPQKFSNVIKELAAVVPSASHHLYFRDEIGNISSSRVGKLAKSTVGLLVPRFPVQKGWKTRFTFGYSIPLGNSLFRQHDGIYQLVLDFSPSVQEMSVDDLQIRVVMPEGSSNIKYALPFRVKSSFDKKFWYFDTIGCPVLILNLKNAVPRHNAKLTVEFGADGAVLWRKPIYFVFIVAAFFGMCMLYNRFELGIGDKKGGHHRAGSSSHSPIDALDKVLHERQMIFKDIVNEISGALETGNAAGARETHASADEEIKDTNDELELLSASIESSHPKASSLLKSLLSKEKSLMGRALQRLSAVMTNSEKGKLKKGSKPSAEDEAIAHVSKQVEEAREKFLAAL